MNKTSASRFAMLISLKDPTFQLFAAAAFPFLGFGYVLQPLIIVLGYPLLPGGGSLGKLVLVRVCIVRHFQHPVILWIVDSLVAPSRLPLLQTWENGLMGVCVNREWVNEIWML